MPLRCWMTTMVKEGRANREARIDNDILRGGMVA